MLSPFHCWTISQATGIVTAVTVDQAPSSEPQARKHAATGVAIAVAGHVFAASLWLYTVFGSVRYAPPDSVFMVTLLTAALELLLFVACMALGFSIRRTHPHLAKGVLYGWLVGLIAIPCGGTMAVGLLTSLI